MANRRVDFHEDDAVKLDRSIPLEILDGEFAALFDSSTACAPRDASMAKAAAPEAFAQDAEPSWPPRSGTAASSTSAPSDISVRSAEMRALVTVIFNGVKHLAGLDTYASHSIIDKAFVERNKLTYTPASGRVELADAGLVAQRIGFLDPAISITLEPPGTTLQHAFEVFNLARRRTTRLPHRP